MYTPLFCFVVVVSMLFLVPSHYIGKIRMVLAVICYFCIVVIFYSKDYTYSDIIDYRVYSQANDILKNMNFFDVFEIFPFEPGWALVYWFLHKLGIAFNGINVSLGNTIISLLIFFIWFECHGIKLVKYEFRGIVTATTLLFMSFVTLGFLQRQAISIAILLFAISNYNNKKFYIYWLFSAIFHNTSLFIGLLYKFIIDLKFSVKLVLLTALFFLFARLFFLDIMLFLNKFDFFAYKSNFYLRISGFQIASYRLALYGVFLSVLAFFYVKSVNNYMRNIIIFTSICFVGLLGINLASERVNFIIIYCLGYFVSLLLVEKNIRALLILNLFMTVLFMLEKTGFINSDFTLWEKYDWIGTTPFYYLKGI